MTRQQIEAETDFEKCVLLVFHAACRNFTAAARNNGAQYDNPFFLAANSIQNAWPDIIERGEHRKGRDEG